MDYSDCSEFTRLLRLLMERVWHPHLRSVVEEIVEEYDGKHGETVSYLLCKADTVTVVCTYSLTTPKVVKISLCPAISEDEGALSIDLEIPRSLEAGDEDVEVAWSIPYEQLNPVMRRVLVACDILPACCLRWEPSLN